jgi:hypothetical protein
MKLAISILALPIALPILAYLGFCWIMARLTGELNNQ